MAYSIFSPLKRRILTLIGLSLLGGGACALLMQSSPSDNPSSLLTHFKNTPEKPDHSPFKTLRLAQKNMQHSLDKSAKQLEQLQASVEEAQKKYDLAAQIYAKKESQAALFSRELDAKMAAADAKRAAFLKAKDALNIPALMTLGVDLKDDKKHYEDALKKLKSVSEVYGENHPTRITAQAQYDTTRQTIIQKLNMFQAKNDQSKAVAEHIREQEMKQRSQDLAERRKMYNQYGEELTQLKRRLQELQTMQHDMQKAYHAQSTAEIETSEEKHLTARSESIGRISASVAIFIFAISALLTVIFDRSRKIFITGQDTEDALNVPCFALIPETQNDKGKPLADYVMDNPTAVTTEAVRAFNLNIKLNSPASDTGEKSGRVITLTSSEQNEGKSTLSLWMARLAAKSGQKVLLVDADLRSPSLHTLLGAKNTRSLVEYLNKTHTLDDITSKDAGSGLDVIYGRAVPTSAGDLLASKAMQELIKTLSVKYDIVIFDTPASLAVADAKAIAKFSDLILYLITWNKTPRAVVHNGVSQFQKFKTPQIATVLSHVDLEKHVKMGHGKAIVHYGDYEIA